MLRVLAAHLDRLVAAATEASGTLKSRGSAAAFLASPPEPAIVDPDVLPRVDGAGSSYRGARGVVLPRDHDVAREKTANLMSLALASPRLRRRYARGRRSFASRSVDATPYDPTLGAES